ncbi:hypothetical protein [Novipirellula caenicola]|uniref:hypothetical protein n=1 Tax=Novipirellula caenicola TaxID=1536901 RepID=UPI0031E84A0B
MTFGDFFDEPERDDTWISVQGDEDIFVEMEETVHRDVRCKKGHHYGGLLNGKFNMRSSTNGKAFSCPEGYHVISSESNQILKQAGFSNYLVAPLDPQPYSRHQHRLWGLCFSDLPMDRAVVYNGTIPKCPSCGSAMVCEYCAMPYGICRTCQKGKLKYFGTEKAFLASAKDLDTFELPIVLPAYRPVVDGSKWNGEDFVNLHTRSIVTRRVLQVFQEAGICPAYGEPIKVWVDKCNESKLKMLEKAKSTDSLNSK